jgi:hypothetical protein
VLTFSFCFSSVFSSKNKKDYNAFEVSWFLKAVVEENEAFNEMRESNENKPNESLQLYLSNVEDLKIATPLPSTNVLSTNFPLRVQNLCSSTAKSSFILRYSAIN